MWANGVIAAMPLAKREATHLQARARFSSRRVRVVGDAGVFVSLFLPSSCWTYVVSDR